MYSSHLHNNVKCHPALYTLPHTLVPHQIPPHFELPNFPQTPHFTHAYKHRPLATFFLFFGVPCINSFTYLPADAFVTHTSCSVQLSYHRRQLQTGPKTAALILLSSV